MIPVRFAALISTPVPAVLLTPDQLVRTDLTVDYELGGVAPFAPNDRTEVLIDDNVLGWQVIFCGTGRNDRTLEIDPRLLVGVAGARVAGLAKYYCE